MIKFSKIKKTHLILLLLLPVNIIVVANIKPLNMYWLSLVFAHLFVVIWETSKQLKKNEKAKPE